MAFRSTRSREVVAPPSAESTLTVPDALLDWGSDPTRVVSWSRDWSREVRDLASRSLDSPLGDKDTQKLLARLEALVVEAIRAGRPDLLLGLDMQTAEWLGLNYSFEDTSGRRLSFGSEGAFGWAEVRVLTEAFKCATLAKQLRAEGSGGEGWPEPEGLGALALHLLMVREEFPSARIAEAGPPASFACEVCGDTGGVTRIEVAPGVFYCRACWPAFKTDETPRPSRSAVQEEPEPFDDEAVADEQKVLERWRAEKVVRDREKRLEDQRRRAEQQKSKSK